MSDVLIFCEKTIETISPKMKETQKGLRTKLEIKDMKKVMLL